MWGTDRLFSRVFIFPVCTSVNSSFTLWMNFQISVYEYDSGQIRRRTEEMPTGRSVYEQETQRVIFSPHSYSIDP